MATNFTTSDGIYMPNVAALQITGQITLCCWAKFSSLGSQWQYILAKTVGDECGLRTSYSNLMIWTYSPNVIAQTALVGAEQNSWIHVCGTYDGSYFNIYVNGSLRGQQADATGAKNQARGWEVGYTVRFGSGRALNNAQIEDARIYNRGLTPAEVMTVASCKGHDNILQGLKARWMFNGVVGASLGSEPDIAGGGYDGTAVASPQYVDSILTSKRRMK